MTRPNGDSINTVSSQGFEGRQGSSGELPGANVEGDTLHSRFYHFVSLKVEATRFRVPRFILENYSAKCRQILKSTTLSGPGEGEVQIQLAYLRAIDFERFLSVLLPADIGQYDVSSLDEWMSILEVAHTLECPSVRKLAINQITSLASAVDKVVLGHKYDVAEWVTEGYIELCQRKASLSSEEGHRLGVDDVVHISNIRFQLITAQTGARIQAGSLLRLCFGPKRHLLGTNRVIDSIGQAKRQSNGDSEPSTKPISKMYTPPYGDFFVWLAKRDSSEQPLEPLAFEEADLVTFATMGPDIGNVPYAVTIERDQNTNLQYQSISCMATYSYYSFEELRFCDYSRGRKVAEEVPYIEGPQPSSWLTPTQASEGLAGLAYSATPSPTAYSNTNSWRQSSNGGGKKNKRR